MFSANPIAALNYSLHKPIRHRQAFPNDTTWMWEAIGGEKMGLEFADWQQSEEKKRI